MPALATLTSLALSAILSIARPPAVDVDAERPRLEAFAASIADAVVSRDEISHWLDGSAAPLPLRGEAAAEGTVLLLVAIAGHESGFRAEVADCRIVGARGDVTAFQLLGVFARGGYSKAELCASPKLASGQALWVLARYGQRCRTPICIFRGYAAGNPAIRSAAASRQCALWVRLACAHGLEASCSSRVVRKRYHEQSS
jgi:hypothetical protein